MTTEELYKKLSYNYLSLSDCLNKCDNPELKGNIAASVVEILKAVKKLETQRNEDKTESISSQAESILLYSGLIDKEDYYTDKCFKAVCEDFVKRNGYELFAKVLTQVKKQQKKQEIRNIKAYIQSTMRLFERKAQSK